MEYTIEQAKVLISIARKHGKDAVDATAIEIGATADISFPNQHEMIVVISAPELYIPLRLRYRLQYFKQSGKVSWILADECKPFGVRYSEIKVYEGKAGIDK